MTDVCSSMAVYGGIIAHGGVGCREGAAACGVCGVGVAVDGGYRRARVASLRNGTAIHGVDAASAAAVAARDEPQTATLVASTAIIVLVGVALRRSTANVLSRWREMAVYAATLAHAAAILEEDGAGAASIAAIVVTNSSCVIACAANVAL